MVDLLIATVEIQMVKTHSGVTLIHMEMEMAIQKIHKNGLLVIQKQKNQGQKQPIQSLSYLKKTKIHAKRKTVLIIVELWQKLMMANNVFNGKILLGLP
jgi:hypothetical protein